MLKLKSNALNMAFFWQIPNSHLNGSGCKQCGTDTISKKLAKTTEQFVSNANKIHGVGTWGYSRVKYINDKTKVEIECFNHDFQHFFWQVPNNHLEGKGCKLCGYETSSKSQAKTTEQFITDANKVHVSCIPPGSLFHFQHTQCDHKYTYHHAPASLSG